MHGSPADYQQVRSDSLGRFPDSFRARARKDVERHFDTRGVLKHLDGSTRFFLHVRLKLLVHLAGLEAFHAGDDVQHMQ